MLTSFLSAIPPLKEDTIILSGLPPVRALLGRLLPRESHGDGSREGSFSVRAPASTWRRPLLPAQEQRGQKPTQTRAVPLLQLYLCAAFCLRAFIRARIRTSGHVRLRFHLWGMSIPLVRRAKVSLSYLRANLLQRGGLLSEHGEGEHGRYKHRYLQSASNTTQDSRPHERPAYIWIKVGDGR